jgi:hypothetical protein
VEPEIFDVIWLRKLNIVEMNRRAGRMAHSEGDMGRLGFIGFQSLF